MNKIKNLINLGKAFWGYKKQSPVCHYNPIRLWIEPTNFCNLRCIMCPNSSNRPIKKGYMDMKLFKEIINKANPFAYDINLSHRGESLLHPHLIEMIKYAKSKNLHLRLNTNATLLTEEKSSQLIKSGLDFISFSFDGFDKETYEKIRRGAKFNDTILNIVDFLKIKKSLKSSTPYALLEVLAFPEVLKQNVVQRENFLKHFKSLPLNKIEIKPLHNWGGNLPSLNGKEIIQKKMKYTPCTNIWYSLTILWDGSVSPCPQDWYNEFSLGNIKDRSLSEIWNSEKMVYLRKSIAKGEFQKIKICRECNLLWRKNVGGIPVLNLVPFLSENIIGYGNLRRIFKPLEKALLNVNVLSEREEE